MSQQRSETPRRRNFHRADGTTYPSVSRAPELVTIVDDLADESPLTRSVPDTSSTIDVAPVAQPLDQATCDRLGEQVTSVASTIEETLRPTPPVSLRTKLTEWCNLHGFDTPTSNPQVLTVIARQVALSILFKATLYEYHHRRGRLPALTGNIRTRLRRAQAVIEDDALSESVLDEIAWRCEDETLAPVLDSRHILLDSGAPAEDIGSLYAGVIKSENRTVLGQFRTPPTIAAVLSRWAETGGDVVLDPGIGGAALSSPGFPNWRCSTDPGRVCGVDRSPLARLMGKLTLTLAGQNHDTHTIDFLELDPDAVTVNSIICNPPYTKYSDLPDEYRAALNDQAERETGREIPEMTPLYGYFLYHARQFLDAGDRLAAITPQQFLNNRYGTVMKQFLLDQFDIDTLVVIDPTNESVFDDAEETALLLLLEAKGQADPSGDTRIIEVQDPDADEWPHAVRNEDPDVTDWGRMVHVEQASLTADEDWRHRVDSLSVETTNLTPLSEIADIKTGISTGANEVFCLTEREADEIGIEDEYLVPLIRRVSSIEGYQYTRADWEADCDSGNKSLLLYLDDLDGVPNSLTEAQQAQQWPAERTDHTPCDGQPPSADLIAYLRSNVSDLKSVTSPWYRVDRRNPAPILVQACGRRFKIVLNQSDALNLNNWHYVYPDADLTTTDRKALVAFLNSSPGQAILQHDADVRSSGSYRILPGKLKDVEVIDPRSLDTGIVEDLAMLFDKLVAAAGNNNEQEVLERINDVVETRVL